MTCGSIGAPNGVYSCVSSTLYTSQFRLHLPTVLLPSRILLCVGEKDLSVRPKKPRHAPCYGPTDPTRDFRLVPTISAATTPLRKTLLPHPMPEELTHHLERTSWY